MAKKKEKEESKIYIPDSFYDHVYMIHYLISYGVDKDEFVNSARDILSEPDYDLPECDGNTMYIHANDLNCIWIWTKEKNTTMLVHEITHATSYCLRSRNIVMDGTESSDEAYAYYNQMLFERITQGIFDKDE